LWSAPSASPLLSPVEAVVAAGVVEADSVAEVLVAGDSAGGDLAAAGG